MEEVSEEQLAHLEKHIALEREAFMTVSGNAETVTFEQSLAHPEVSEWLANSTRTRDQLQEAWNLCAPGESKVLDFEVCNLARGRRRRVVNIIHSFVCLPH